MTPTFPANHFRQVQGLRCSSIGLGTYLGELDAATDAQLAAAVRAALAGGVNVIDTAINYRAQRSERVIGAVLRELVQQGPMARESVVISTKGGYLPFDGEWPADPQQYVEERFLRSGLCTPDEIVAGCHCLAPTYLQDQLTTSLRNLQLGGVDIYFLHNPEQQLDEVSRGVFEARLGAAFEFLETEVAAGRMRLYGCATWQGFRIAPNAPQYLSLARLLALAHEVAGAQHHFRAIQLPYNFAMPEALTLRNQLSEGQMFSTLELAERHGLLVMASASLLQGQLTRGLPSVLQELFPGRWNDAQRALQFVRSTPGVTTALVGMKQAAHVADNLALAGSAPLTREEFRRYR